MENLYGTYSVVVTKENIDNCYKFNYFL